MTFDKNYGYDLPERQIMINSAFVNNEFPELVKVLEKYESLNERAAKEFDEKLREILDRETLVKIYERSKEEWSAVKDGFNLKVEVYDWSDNIHCQLCGQHITKKYFIKNKVNGIELYVGSECIKKYEINVDLQKGQTREEFFHDQQKFADRIRREKIFNEKFPNINQMIDSWNKFIERCSIMIPKNLEDKYNSLLVNANKIYNGFLEGKLNLKNIRSFTEVQKNIKNVQDEIRNYIDEKKDDELVVDKNVEKWLLRKIQSGNANSKELYDKLKINGKIDIDTFPYIHEKNFINKYIGKINSILHEMNYEIYDIDYDNEKFNIVYGNLLNVKLEGNMTSILKLISKYIFKKEEIDISDIKYKIVDECKIVDEESVEQSILILGQKLKKYNLKIDWYGLKLKKCIISHNQEGYIVSELLNFVDIHKKFLLFDIYLSVDFLRATFKKKQVKPIESLKDEIADMEMLENMEF